MTMLKNALKFTMKVFFAILAIQILITVVGLLAYHVITQ